MKFAFGDPTAVTCSNFYVCKSDTSSLVVFITKVEQGRRSRDKHVWSKQSVSDHLYNIPVRLPGGTKTTVRLLKMWGLPFKKECPDNRRISLWKSLSVWADACLHTHSLWAQLWCVVLHVGTNTPPGWPSALVEQLKLRAGGLAAPTEQGLVLSWGRQRGCWCRREKQQDFLVAVALSLGVNSKWWWSWSTEAQEWTVLICQVGSSQFAVCTHWETLGFEPMVRFKAFCCDQMNCTLMTKSKAKSA